MPDFPSEEELKRAADELTEEREDRDCYNCGKSAAGCKANPDVSCCRICHTVGYDIGHTYSDLEITSYRAIRGLDA